MSRSPRSRDLVEQDEKRDGFIEGKVLFAVAEYSSTKGAERERKIVAQRIRRRCWLTMKSASYADCRSIYTQPERVSAFPPLSFRRLTARGGDDRVGKSAFPVLRVRGDLAHFF